MIRKIIQIDEDKCNGCGACAKACHEGAIKMINGKAKLIRDDYCDGLGDCLPACPTAAITFVEREALPYDEEAVNKNKQNQNNSNNKQPEKMPCGCPGTFAKSFKREASTNQPENQNSSPITSQLRQWPVQIKLANVNAPFFNNSNLLIAADCAAYAYADFHGRFMKNKVTLIGCPKLDSVDYSDKLTEIIKNNEIKSVTVVRMEVPCCGGIEAAVKKALQQSGKFIPWQIVTVTTDGNLIE